MPTEENQNQQTTGSSNPVSQTDPVNQDINLDIDLNLDGLDLPKKTLDEFTIDENFGKKQEVFDYDILDNQKDMLVDNNQKQENENLIIDDYSQPITNDQELRDLDLTSIGKMVNEENKEIKVKDDIDNKDNQDDRLLQEDKKVEDIEQAKTKSVEIIEDQKFEGQNINLKDLDIPFVDKDLEVSNNIEIEKNDQNKERGNETIEKNNVDEFKIEEYFGENKRDNKSIEINEISQGTVQDLHIENMGDNVIENNNGDIVSDTGNIDVKKGDYVPNEHDFNQLSEALNSASIGGEVNLSNLTANKDDNKNLELGVGEKSLNVQNIGLNNSFENNGGLDLDAMISQFEKTPVVNNTGAEGLIGGVMEKDVFVKDEIQTQPINNPVINQNQNEVDFSQNIKIIDQSKVEVGQNVNVINNPVMEQIPVNNQVQNFNNNIVQNVPTSVTNAIVQSQAKTSVNTGIPAGAVILSSFPQEKNTHTGLKVFVIILVLLVGGFFVLSKMYPQEISDIMSAIKGEDQTVIEYEKDSEIVDETQSDEITNQDDLNEQNQLDVVESEVIEEVPLGDDIVEELDPDSLAGQLQADDSVVTDGILQVEENILDEQSGAQHNADSTDFDAFEGLEDVIDSSRSGNNELLDKLHVYQNKGIEYDTWGREINNTTAMKYGLYISEKSEKILFDIENGINIDNLTIEDYFAQFDKYLEKLNNLRLSIDGVVESEILSDEIIDDTNNQSEQVTPETTESTGQTQEDTTV